MYASKRRQRNFKRIREPPKPGASSNPSKRHRERLNGELETVAALLPYDQSVISRLDKLSVLRLAVAYLQIKAHFQVLVQHQYLLPYPYTYHHPVLLSDQYDGTTLIGCALERIYDYEDQSLKALSGFLLILNENGEIYYASSNIESYLGFHQSDILHQPLFDMIHSEDRDEIRQQLLWNYLLPPLATMHDLFTIDGQPYLERNINARFRCLLDNTCGFLRIDMRGKLMALHGLPQSYVMGRIDTNPVLGLVAVCSPFVSPPNIDGAYDIDPILKTKHALDFTLLSMDHKTKCLLELDDKSLPISFYAVVHCDDAICLAEAHKEVAKNGASGLLIYRMISFKSQRTYWMQSSCRQFYKNGKPESIGCTHRVLTESEGVLLLEKRSTLSAKIQLSFDDSLLQSPKMIQSTAALSIDYSRQQQPPAKNHKRRSRHEDCHPSSAAVAINCNNNVDVQSIDDSSSSRICVFDISQELNNSLAGMACAANIPSSSESMHIDPYLRQYGGRCGSYFPSASDLYYQSAYAQAQNYDASSCFQIHSSPSSALTMNTPSSAHGFAFTNKDHFHNYPVATNERNVSSAMTQSSSTGVVVLGAFDLISEVTNTLLGQ